MSAHFKPIKVPTDYRFDHYIAWFDSRDGSKELLAHVTAGLVGEVKYVVYSGQKLILLTDYLSDAVAAYNAASPAPEGTIPTPATERTPAAFMGAADGAGHTESIADTAGDAGHTEQEAP
jgi:hypothetical protein